MTRFAVVVLVMVAALSAGACTKTGSSSPVGQKQPNASPVATSDDLVPAAERERMRALLPDEYAYVPASLPAGFIYIDWKHAELTPHLAGQLLTIDFASPGAGQIVWTSSRACDTKGRVRPSATGYPGYGYGMITDRSAVINGRVVYFSTGNHGSNAWTSIPVETADGTDYVAVGVWESNCLTPEQAMQLVAYAVPA
jgi:hypothetical protein